MKRIVILTSVIAGFVLMGGLGSQLVRANGHGSIGEL